MANQEIPRKLDEHRDEYDEADVIGEYKIRNGRLRGTSKVKVRSRKNPDGKFSVVWTSWQRKGAEDSYVGRQIGELEV